MDSNREDLQRSLSSRTLLSIRPIAGQSLQSRQYAPQNRYPENYLISLIRFIWVNGYGSHAGYAIGMLRFEIQSRAYCWPIDDWRSRTDSSSWSLLRARMFLAPGQSLSYSSWVSKNFGKKRRCIVWTVGLMLLTYCSERFEQLGRSRCIIPALIPFSSIFVADHCHGKSWHP